MVDEESLSGKLLILRLWFGQVRTGEVEFTTQGMVAFEALLSQCQGEALVLETPIGPAEPSNIVPFRKVVGDALSDALASPTEPEGGAA